MASEESNIVEEVEQEFSVTVVVVVVRAEAGATPGSYFRFLVYRHHRVLCQSLSSF